MSRIRVATVMVFAAGVLTALAGDRFASDRTAFAGIGLAGLAGVLLGLDTIRTRRLVTVSRYDRRDSETWLGIAAIGQGVTIALTGLFLTGAAALAMLGTGRGAVVFFVRHPGGPLLAFAALCFAAAASAIAGSVEEKQGQRWLVLLNLATSRLLPGVVLLALGAAATALGVLEIVAPSVFDRLGGGFLEVLFGAAS